MALKTFTATRAVAAGDGKRLASWYLSAAGTALVVNFCDKDSGTPFFAVQVGINSSAQMSYHPQGAPVFPSGLHIELVSGALTRGCVDLL